MAASMDWLGPALDGTNQLINMNFQQNQNKRNQRWQEEMYWMDAQQKVDRWNENNAYMEGMWNKQNAYNEKIWKELQDYNSPAAQMARFKAAGLNPNLIYGQGNMVSPQGVADFKGSGMASTGNIPANNRPAPQMSNTNMWAMGQALAQDTHNKEAQTNNLEAQNQVLQQEAAQKAVATAGMLTKNEHSAFDLRLAQELRQTGIDSAREALKQAQNNTKFQLNEEERKAAASSMNLREAAQRILNMRGQHWNNYLESQLKQYEIDLNARGLQKNDALLFRYLGEFLENAKTEWKQQNWVPKSQKEYEDKFEK